MPSKKPPRTYSYDDIATLLQHRLELSKPPSTSTLRTAQVRQRRPNAATSIVAGMPAPLPHRLAGRTVFDATAIDRWIAAHPRRQRQAVWRRLVSGLRRVRRDDKRTALVVAAVQAGLSWQEVADAFAEVDGQPRSRQWAHDRYAADVTAPPGPAEQ